MMGGDQGIPITTQATVLCARKYQDVSFKLLADESKIKTPLPDNCQIIHCPQSISMDEDPVSALRTKKQSSMRLALDYCRENPTVGFVSAGNTGALVAISRYCLKMLPGISRPAIIKDLPTKSLKKVFILDIGANVDCSPEQLYEFARMGVIAARISHKVTDPIVRLLNNGTEEIKGTDVVKKAHKLLQSAQNINYKGFIEPDRIYSEETNIVVTDGFVGNVLLKTAEGTAKLIASIVKNEIYNSFYGKFIAILSKPFIKKLYTKINPDEYNGATLLGLNGVVVKSHGSANVNAFANAIENCLEYSKNDLVGMLKNSIN